MRRARRAWALAAAVALVLAGCGDGAAQRHEITVLAASSLTEAFTAIGSRFESTSGVAVTFTFAGSSALVAQANSGVPAEVIATADRASYRKVIDVGPPTVVARNRLVILVGTGNPKGITGLADLARPDVVTVLCAPEVPCGALAAGALARAGVAAHARSLEENVKGVVSKITLGEADAGIVYATDARSAAPRAEGVAVDAAITGDPSFEAVYPMGVLHQAGDAALAREWITFVAGPVGQKVLRSFGFLPPR